MAKGDTKRIILDAAARVMLARGAANLTLEAVAEEAGLSKGGLLYHYADKDALLAAMVQRLVEVTEARVADHRETDAEPGGWTRGYLQACLVDDQPATDPTGRLAIALLAAAAGNSALMDGLRRRQAHWRDQLSRDGIDPALANVVRLAADGLWLNDLLGIPALDGGGATHDARDSADRRAQVLAKLEELTRR
jgi:AcrR family transcriptional regulator